MLKKILAVMIGLMFLSPGASVLAQTPKPVLTDYQDRPLLATGYAVPAVLLVLSKDQKMFLQAYSALIDFDGDGVVDTGFNPGVKYIGYFDPYSCYGYAGTVNTNGDANGYFYRAGPGVPQTQAQADALRPNSIKDIEYVVSPASLTGLCGTKVTGSRSGTAYSGRTFSGNWLNYQTMSRMDVIRKILYGGYRSTDGKNPTDKTILESSLVPPDAHAWGSDVLADDRWLAETPQSAYYDVSLYTPFDKPETGKVHFFTRSRSFSSTNIPVLRYVLNISSKSFGTEDSFGNGGSTGEGRYWDWVMGERPNPNDVLLNNSTSGNKDAARNRIAAVTIRNQICEKGNYSDTEGCKEYPNGNVKPIGLLQKYGEGGNQMSFGLMTGAYGDDSSRTVNPPDGTRTRGGVLRHHIQPISSSVNPDNGLIKRGKLDDSSAPDRGSLIWTMDSLRITGRSDTSPTNDYQDSASWGNPTGEMLYEAVRYFASLHLDQDNTAAVKSTAVFTNGSEVAVGTGDRATLNKIINWGTSTRPQVEGLNCIKPVILLISDIESDYDGDNIPNGVLNQSRLKDTKNTDLSNSFKMTDYLDEIDKVEKFTSSGKKYFFSRGSNDNCISKTLTALKDVKGMCPNTPALEGTYSAAAVAYYARTHNFGSTAFEMPVNIFTVTMASAFPELVFPLPESDGTVTKKISIQPASTSNRHANSTYNRVIGYINYYIVDWQVDKNGTPFSITIQVNFEDAIRGVDGYGTSDWDMDVLVEYKIDLLTTSATPASMRTSSPLYQGTSLTNTSVSRNQVASISGELKGQTLYGFKNPSTAKKRDDFITIDPSRVVGLAVYSRQTKAAAGLSLGQGYTINGTTRDGTYIDLAHNNSYQFTGGILDYNTPPTCPYAAASTSSYPHSSCGKTHTTKAQVRTFIFSNEGAKDESLPNPLWLAAKYGGFNDYNKNGIPDDGEWEKDLSTPGKGDPANYFKATNISDLADQLAEVFQAISNLTSTGTSTAASVNSVMGGGISVMTLYYPEFDKAATANSGEEQKRAKWLGSIYSLFVDKWGNMREDSDGDGNLTITNCGSAPGDWGTRTICLKHTDETNTSHVHDKSNLTACVELGTEEYCLSPIGDMVVEFDETTEGDLKITRYYDPIGDGNLEKYTNDLNPTLDKVKTVWNTAQWLANLTDAQATTSRAFNTTGGRLVYYGHPTVDSTGVETGLTLNKFNATNSSVLLPHMLHNSSFIAATDANAKKLINYILGQDNPTDGWRTRQTPNPWGTGNITWRLGDVINSKPIIVGSANAHYDLLYGDASYDTYSKAVALRRQMVYSGANDGMLHAINLGFYGSLRTGLSGYSVDTDANGVTRSPAHELGAEVWAFIPTAVLPHLQWLANPDYEHSYYVDLKPLLVDMKIGTSGDQYGGWRTVLIGGLRLGGRSIESGATITKPKYSYAEYFALDVTDPDSEPKLLWRYSSKELGLGVSVPTVVTSQGQWYVILASGPTTDASDGSPGGPEVYKGISNQKARLIILNATTGNPAVATSSAAYQANLVAPEDNSFFNDSFTPMSAGRTTPWHNYTVYYGMTISRTNGLDKGSIYRLQMIDGKGDPLPVEEWKLKRFFNTERPVTGAANATYDNVGNMWVVFGTGRLWASPEDLIPCTGGNPADACHVNHQQYIYGIKEPLHLITDSDTTKGVLTFEDQTSRAGDLIDVSGISVYEDGTMENVPSGLAGLTVSGGQASYNALTIQVRKDNYIGYKRALITRKITGTDPDKDADRFEMLLTQPKIDALANGQSFMGFTTYEPPESLNEACDSGASTQCVDKCAPRGRSFLYMVDTYTGLPAPYMVQFAQIVNPDSPSSRRQVSGFREAGTGQSTEAVITATALETNTQAGAKKPIPLPNELLSSAIISWREVLDMGFTITPSERTKGLDETNP